VIEVDEPAVPLAARAVRSPEGSSLRFDSLVPLDAGQDLSVDMVAALRGLGLSLVSNGTANSDSRNGKAHRRNGIALRTYREGRCWCSSCPR
jgi:hypothetical protein